MKKRVLFATLLSFTIVCGCTKPPQNSTNKKTQVEQNQKQKLITVFHAGSLSVPLSKLKEKFLETHPNLTINLEAAGSVACARKIADLKKTCDLMVSADYQVIDKILIPNYASWCIKFATNQLSIVYTPKSHYAKEINTKNWHKILMRDNVICGASNPNEDPCGYRTVIMLKLASLYYKQPNLFNTVYSNKSKMIIRPKETDLISLLEAHAIDYMFIYKSVAIQHEMPYVDLPPQINLGNPEFSEFYKKASVDITGKTPGSTITQTGAPIVYGLTIPSTSASPEAAEEFIQFMLSSEGLKIIKECGQMPIIPSPTKTYNNIPKALQKFADK